jgi:phosphoglycolate phosphatase-like HAD superfamily hydrolase
MTVSGIARQATGMTRLVLWDIDGTLIDGAGLGRDAFMDAFERVTGTEPDRLVPFAGRTDLEIAHDLLEASGIDPSDGLLGAFGEALADALGARAGLLRERGRPLPGARESLERLRDEPGVVQSVLTGNIEPNAQVKLAAFGLDSLMDLEIGAYGSDDRMRGQLVDVARRKARELRGVEAEVVLIGDTPLDVAAALEGAARAIGVASGSYDEDDLREAGAHAVLPSLADVDEVVRAALS